MCPKILTCNTIPSGSHTTRDVHRYKFIIYVEYQGDQMSCLAMSLSSGWQDQRSIFGNMSWALNILFSIIFMYIYQIPLECNEMRNTLPIIHILYTYPSQDGLLQPFDVNRTVASNHDHESVWNIEMVSNEGRIDRGSISVRTGQQVLDLCSNDRLIELWTKVREDVRITEKVPKKAFSRLRAY